MKMFGKPEQQRKFEKFSGKLVMFLAMLLMFALVLFIGYWFLVLLLWLGRTYVIPAVVTALEYGLSHFYVVILLLIMSFVLVGILEVSIKDKE